ncbi:MAG: response regulator [Leptospirales bacterium]|jgi:DNA-binding response OmpR family regulator
MAHKALIIDDDPSIVSYLRQILSAEGFAVATGGRAFEAVNLYERLKPDVLLLDINMPGSDGFFALKRIRTRTRAAGHAGVIIMVSAREAVEDIDQAISHGANDYLVKPVDRASLMRKIRKHLRI